MPALAFLVVTYVVPILGLLTKSFGSEGWTLRYYADVMSDTLLWRVFAETFVLAAQVTLICAVIAYPLAYVVLRLPERMQKLALLLMLMPLWTSVLVRAYAWIVLLGRQGIVNDALVGIGIVPEPLQILYGRFAVALGLVHLLIPFVFFPLFAVMRRFDGRLLSAAESLGANPVLAFLLVFLPLTLPGLLSGSLIVFLHGIGYFVTPAILGGLKEVTYVMLIEEQVNTLFNWEQAAVMAVILLVATLVIVLVCARTLGLIEGGGDAPSKPSGTFSLLLHAAGAVQARLRGGLDRSAGRSCARVSAGAADLLGKGFAVATLLFLLTPIFILLPLSFSASPFLQFPPSGWSLRWYETYFSRPDWTGPTLTSFQVAVVSAILVTALGLAAAVGVTRSRSRLAQVSLALMLSPAMIPTLIIAVALYFQMSSIGLAGTRIGLIISHLVIGLPIVVLILIGGLRQADQRPEMAARSLGAAPLRAFMKTTFVAIRPSIVAAGLFAFLASFDDVTVALFISGTSAVTLPVKMWESVRLELDPTLAAVSSVLVVFSIALLSLSEVAKRLGRGNTASPPG
ncbi:ABC transporter permease subunit [Bosea sp. (in: a-proteobacteria)]|uniref:ABC transporter permease subunit n=1 Tax=Bosea sp. (in: a-proteobacteria) TaxID=1871050 RepID=UPI00260C487B|nr:ABC transporter permease subunit [Bosea sp. (in: a-proteobacteria)]MCO5091315.1 ABC transporter permease subunit [Bosea sp. (in: a-proteobacteria)]